MTLNNQSFFQELSRELGNHPNKQEILNDYKMHAQEMLQEEAIDEEHIYSELTTRLGTPREIAAVWRQETAVTPTKMQWLFVLLNAVIFIGGILLTISYHMFHWTWVAVIWDGLTELPSIIMLVYIMFWGLLGYEIGKEFGHSGQKLLRKTFVISIVPNLLFMYLIVFRIIPHSWFQPFISTTFILICIIFTGILYPVCWIGYRWGRRTSV